MKKLFLVILAVFGFSVIAETLEDLKKELEKSIEVSFDTTQPFSTATISNVLAEAKTKALIALASNDDREYRSCIKTIYIYIDSLNLEKEIPVNKMSAIRDVLQRLAIINHTLERKFIEVVASNNLRLKHLHEQKDNGDVAYGINLDEARKLVIGQLSRNNDYNADLNRKMKQLETLIDTQLARTEFRSEKN